MGKTNITFDQVRIRQIFPLVETIYANIKVARFAVPNGLSGGVFAHALIAQPLMLSVIQLGLV